MRKAEPRARLEPGGRQGSKPKLLAPVSRSVLQLGHQGPEEGVSEKKEWSRSLLAGGWGVVKGQRREGDRPGADSTGEGGEAGWLSGGSVLGCMEVAWSRRPLVHRDPGPAGD